MGSKIIFISRFPHHFGVHFLPQKAKKTRGNGIETRRSFNIYDIVPMIRILKYMNLFVQRIDLNFRTVTAYM